MPRVSGGVDFFLALLYVFFIVLGFFITCCLLSRRKSRPIYQTPVVVTSATHTAPGGYPTGVQAVSVYPTATTNYQQGVYPQQAPYPVSSGYYYGGMPMPMPVGQAPMNPPQAGMMPPYPTTGPSMNPPSYDTAVGTGTNLNASNPAYEKQSPYNPNYAASYQ